MWEIDNLSQLLGFLYSAVLGGIYCMVYDVLRAFRTEIEFSTLAVCVTDVLYSLVCAVTCFCFLLSVTGGQPRAFVFAGAAVGFMVIRLTVSRILFFVFSKAIKGVSFVFDKISALFSRFFDVVGTETELLGKKAEKICVLSLNTLKKHLKKK
ncbi:MAG: spore cortex biosynthesis protein YabQ [Acutalibacteraceae bacterium]|nr:spore cortex biosynthesis protein YabQ [Acutalibacteraceae bacterium]